MAREQTLSIIKPDAVRKELIGEILTRFERSGLRIKALKMVQLSLEQAKAFYTVHKDRPFYEGLCTFMASGPVVVALLEGQDAIASTRELMGATNPKEAAPGTIRAEFAEDIEANAVHGSDSPETAVWEADFFFDRLERCER